MEELARTTRELPGWFFAGPAASLRPGRLRKLALVGQSIVLFRSLTGQLGALDGRCSHLGADLSQGRWLRSPDGDGERLQCPFHNWCYDPSGRCRSGPGLGRHQTPFPIQEKWGYLWVFLGPQPLYDLPHLDDPDPLIYHVGPVDVAVHPHLLLANGVDSQHFEALHKLEFTAPAEVSRPTPYSVRNRMQIRPPSALQRWLTGTPITADYLTLGASLAWFNLSSPYTHFTVLFNPSLAPNGRATNHLLFFCPRPYGLTALRMLATLPSVFNEDSALLEALDFHPGYTPEDKGLLALAEVVNRLQTS